MANRFAQFSPTYDQLVKNVNRAEVLALVDALSLSLTKRAYGASDPTLANWLGNVGSALQDLRFELYSRMAQEQETGATYTSTMADFGDSPSIRTTYKPYGNDATSDTGSVVSKLGKYAVSRALKMFR